VDTRCYVESDGRIILVRRGSHFDLPSPDEVPFPVDRIAPLAPDGTTWFCVPRLDRHPHDWPSKDEVDSRDDVTPIVRVAVHATMPRVVVEGVCLHGRKILLVKGNRGLTENRWTLPGGFLRFGESPRDGILRELREEIGVDATVEQLLDVRAKIGLHTRLHWIMVFFRVRIDGDPCPNPDEIAEARFVDLGEAADLVSDDLMRCVIEAISQRPRGRPA